MSWVLELRMAGCIYAGSSVPSGIYQIPAGEERRLRQINIVHPTYGKEWNRFGWLVAYRLPENWNEPPLGEVWKLPDIFRHYYAPGTPSQELSIVGEEGDRYTVISVFHPVKVPGGYPLYRDEWWYYGVVPPEKNYVLIRSLRLDTASQCKHYLYRDGTLIDAITEENDVIRHSFCYEFVFDTTSIEDSVKLRYENTSKGEKALWLVEYIRDGYLLGWYFVNADHPLEITVPRVGVPGVKRVDFWGVYRGDEVYEGETYQSWDLHTRVILSMPAPYDLQFEYKIQYFLSSIWTDTYAGRVTIKEGEWYGEDVHNIWYRGAAMKFRSCVKDVCSDPVLIPNGGTEPELPPPPEYVPPPEFPTPEVPVSRRKVVGIIALISLLASSGYSVYRMIGRGGEKSKGKI